MRRDQPRPRATPPRRRQVRQVRQRADGRRAGRAVGRSAARLHRRHRTAGHRRLLGRLVRALSHDGAAIRRRRAPAARRALRQGRQRRCAAGERELRHPQHPDADPVRQGPRSGAPLGRRSRRRTRGVDRQPGRRGPLIAALHRVHFFNHRVQGEQA